MARVHAVAISSSARHLLQLVWDWHGHNPINCFEYRETPAGSLLSHPASQSRALVSGEALVALIEQGWLRGGQQLMLTNAGVAACRQLSERQVAIVPQESSSHHARLRLAGVAVEQF